MIALSCRLLRAAATLLGSLVIIAVATPVLFWLGRPDPEPSETFPSTDFDAVGEDFRAVMGDPDDAGVGVDASDVSDGPI